MLVIGLVHHPLARARLTEALRGRGVLRLCETCDEARQLVFSAGVGAAILEPRDRDGVASWPLVGTIRTDFPSLPVMAYCSIGNSLSRDIVDMVRAGADELVIRDCDDTAHRLRRALNAARGTCTSAWAISELAPLVPLALQPPLEYCLANAARSVTVDELAKVFGVHRKTLVNRYARADIIPPSTIIAFARILLAAQLLEDRGRPLEQIALELEFPTGGALRAMMKRHLRLSPREVRENGGARCALSAFKAALRPQRAAAQRVAPMTNATQALTVFRR